MGVYKCISKAFYQNRLWDPSEDRRLITSPGEKPNTKCFVPVGLDDVAPVVADKEPMTMSEMTALSATAELKTSLMRMTKDDLIAEANKLGLSEGNNLTKVTNKDLVILISGELDKKLAITASDDVFN